VVVVPDRGGQGQDALQNSHHHSGRGVAAVSFQVELALEGLVDRFDGHRSRDLLPHNALFYARGQPRRAAETKAELRARPKSSERTQTERSCRSPIRCTGGAVALLAV
jgi:hypothetical protein